MSISRERARRSPDESRAAAIAAARGLLLEAGPQAVTLKAVADKIGRTHANLLHHFGSAAGLQAELARSIAEEVAAAAVAVSVEPRQRRRTPARSSTRRSTPSATAAPARWPRG